jgi:hypothetical protein
MEIQSKLWNDAKKERNRARWRQERREKQPAWRKVFQNVSCGCLLDILAETFWTTVPSWVYSASESASEVGTSFDQSENIDSEYSSSSGDIEMFYTARESHHSSYDDSVNNFESFDNPTSSYDRSSSVIDFEGDDYFSTLA